MRTVETRNGIRVTWHPLNDRGLPTVGSQLTSTSWQLNYVSHGIAEAAAAEAAKIPLLHVQFMVLRLIEKDVKKERELTQITYW